MILHGSDLCSGGSSCCYGLSLWSVTCLFTLKQSVVALVALHGLSLHLAWHAPHEVGKPREQEGIFSQISGSCLDLSLSPLRVCDLLCISPREWFYYLYIFHVFLDVRWMGNRTVVSSLCLQTGLSQKTVLNWRILSNPRF